MTATTPARVAAVPGALDEETPPGRNPARTPTSWLLTIFMLLCVGYFLLPLFWLLVASTKSNDDLFSSFGLWFADFNLLENIRTVLTFQDGVFIRWALNSLIYAVVSAVGASVLATAAGYAFAKYQFPGGTILFSIILGAIMIPLAALTVPTYLLFARVGLTDSYWAIILPSLALAGAVAADRRRRIRFAGSFLHRDHGLAVVNRAARPCFPVPAALLAVRPGDRWRQGLTTSKGHHK
ncbi:MAG: carbohydrate transporter permease [Propionibacteriaceae bacterium]|nr:carbohydrate transporter permease [Propionibacteriaceae bacterium]